MVDDVQPVDAGAPTQPDASHTDETIVPMWKAEDQVALPDPGYQLGELIGRGGMGEVLVAEDLRIGREVAVKRISQAMQGPDAVARFLREARIQARLDHPAICPVYELGTDATGRPYFTMKRLSGETLAQKLAQKAPVQRLLRAFIDVCLAIELAHARGVVHRDLKPSNIMLGDYGEVYVLDWGVARVLVDRRRTTQPVKAVDIQDTPATGSALLGTPGYMSPEQVEGKEVDPASDVYALGAILFEILAGQPLHPRGSGALAATLAQPQQRPSHHAPDRAIAPELDTACFDALARDPAARPSARALADRVQAYVDGDRDLERRKQVAAEQLAEARAQLATGGPDARANAMRLAGRALALDPQAAEAAQLVTSLVLEPPVEMPPDLVRSIEREERAFHRVRSRQGAFTYLSLFALWLVIPFLHVKDWVSLIAFFALLALAATASSLATRNRTGRSSVAVTWVITTSVVLAFSRVAGPFMLTPIVVVVTMMSIVAVPAFRGRLLVVWAALAALLPVVLEWTGLIARTYHVEHGAVVTVSALFDMRSGFDEGTLVVTNVLFMMTAALVAIGLNRSRFSAQRELQIRAWHLRQLLPESATLQTVQPSQRSAAA